MPTEPERDRRSRAGAPRGACTFTGSHHDLVDRGPFNFPLRLGLWFDALRTKVIITDFPAIPVGPIPVEVPLIGVIPVMVTVTMVSGESGSYSATNGAITLNLTLSFDVDMDFPFIEEDSLLPLTLATAPGTGVAANGGVSPAARQITAFHATRRSTADSDQ